MRTDQINSLLEGLLDQQQQANIAANAAIAKHAEDPSAGHLPEALEQFAKVEALRPEINALQQALESAEVHDRADAEAAIKTASAADKDRAISLAAKGRVKVAADVDKAFTLLALALKDLAALTPEIDGCMGRAVHAHQLSPLRKGEQLAMLRGHARHDGPAFAYALAHSINTAIAAGGFANALHGLVDFKIDMMQTKGVTMTDAARLCAEGLRTRLSTLSSDC